MPDKNSEFAEQAEDKRKPKRKGERGKVEETGRNENKMKKKKRRKKKNKQLIYEPEKAI